MDRQQFIVFGAVLLAITVGAVLLAYSPANVFSRIFAMAKPVTFSPVAKGVSAYVLDRVNYAIYTPEELNELWALLPDAGPQPTVDFSKEAVVAVFGGQVTQGGHSIEVEKIIDRGGERMVSVSIATPAPECITTQAIETPYQVVIVPKTTHTLAHEDIPAVRSCAE